jgi:hypothetical protein
VRESGTQCSQGIPFSTEETLRQLLQELGTRYSADMTPVGSSAHLLDLNSKFIKSSPFRMLNVYIDNPHAGDFEL